MESLKTESNELLGPVPVPDPHRQPLLEHLEEFRRRLLRSFLWIGIATAVSFRYSEPILRWLVQPLGKVVFLSPAEPFLVHLKVAFLSGLLLSLPLLFWEIWQFFTPAFLPSERKPVLLLVLLSVGLFFLGAVFSWAVLIPAALKFLMGFSSDILTPMVTVGSYVSFTGWLILAGGLIFQMPMVVLLLAKLQVIHPWSLLRHWRIALVLILVGAAVLTPTPDVITQLLLAVPMCVLYLFSIGLAALVTR